MRKMILLVAFMTGLTVSGQEISYQNISIEPYLSFQNYEHFKRLVLISDVANVEYIEDFKFEWGFTYKLKVMVSKLKYEMSDGTTHEYYLEEIISKTKVADSSYFKLFIDPHLYYNAYEADEPEMNNTLKLINDSTYTYLDEVEIEVPMNLRVAFKAIADGGRGKLGNFTFVNEKRIRLISM
jgi:Domain of unknown function (DUF4377)